MTAETAKFPFDMTPTKMPVLLGLAAVLAMSPTVHRLLAADATPAPPTTPLTAAPAGAGQPSTQVPPPGARRGGGGRGGPITPEEQAAVAKLAELPTWKPGAPDGDYTIAP